jgi:hypothetical protein
VVDTEITTKHAGEIKQITSVDPTSGSITVDDEIFDIYTLADSAQVVRITMLQNIPDFSITTLNNIRRERQEGIHPLFTSQ